MNVLITGGNGFLGQYLVKHFESLNHDIITLGRHSADIICDLANKEPVIDGLPEIVIHTAGKAHSVPVNREEEKLFFQVNVQGTANLLQALNTNKALKRFVFISSVAVYGTDEGNGIDETHPLAAKDAYGRSKIEAEKMIQEWCRMHNVSCTILRLPIVIGEDAPGNFGNMVKGIRKGYYFNVSGGKARRSMVLASDVAKIVLKASEKEGVYNLTDGMHPSFGELSREVASQMNKRIISVPYIFAKIASFAGDIIGSRFPLDSTRLKKITSTLIFDDSRARRLLGWSPTSVLKGLKL